MYTFCPCICLVSCFIPSIVCSLLSPSVLATQGSSTTFSAATFCWFSLDTASIVCPFFVATVIADALIRVGVGFCVVSGRCGVVCWSIFRCCLGGLPSVMPSAISCFIGTGTGVHCGCVSGAVAIGKSVIVG